ncbi:LytTR family DNA-binding domain-containing protein [uncultured Sunxiuqinia sp.]|uniref:LytR/AlgR family response regulator transcription factor n=1 Tax=uncultured Sunxiuqinia sp. TaxID=1573825 RepID=UPI002AA7F201|nr:LytTR family DNA-binding domain-containing protein [uncultured Sunxiuqinia sp.]
MDDCTKASFTRKEEVTCACKNDAELSNNTEAINNFGEKCFHILVYVRDEILPVKVDDIVIAYAEDRYRFITTADDTFLVSHTLNELEKMLGHMHFRINRQFIVSYQIINKIYVKENATLNVEIKHPVNKVLSVSKRRSSLFRQWLTNPFRKR